MSPTSALVRTQRALLRYRVVNLSVSGAMLSDGPLLNVGAVFECVLLLPLYPPIRVPATVVHHASTLDGHRSLGIAFMHDGDQTEDHIQSALLSELERKAADRSPATAYPS